MDLTKTSKFLSLILRHKPETIGITLDSHGWADVKELIEGISKTRTFNMEILEEIVRTDEKQRYSFNENKTKIRANQGHSINVDVELKEMIPPTYLYHGTNEKVLWNIKKQGLKKQSRLYVHLTDNKDTAFKTGKRHGGNTIIFMINSWKMKKDGIKFYQSENGVWLTDYVDPKYIVATFNQKIILYSGWSFIPDKKFINKMNELGFTDYDDTDLRLHPEMIKFIEENLEDHCGDKRYLSEKADTHGRVGITNTIAWIDYVDTTQTWDIINGSYPFIGAEKIVYYTIEYSTNNRVHISEKSF